MNFLLTNDDSLTAKELAFLNDVINKLGTPYLVVPLEEHSNGGHRVSYDPIQVDQRSDHEFGVGGTPADCIRLGLKYLVPPTDWVLSGINHGANLGGDVYLSGTVAAAREAAMCGRPAVALSHYRDSTIGDFYWDHCSRWTFRVIGELIERPLRRGEYWNVNFPHLPTDSAEPELVECKLEPETHDLTYQQTGSTYQYQGSFQSRGRTIGSDVDVCFGGNISITKISLHV